MQNETRQIAEKLIRKFDTQEKAAKELGITVVWFNKVYNGKVSPSSALLRLMRILAG